MRSQFTTGPHDKILLSHSDLSASLDQPVYRETHTFIYNYTCMCVKESLNHFRHHVYCMNTNTKKTCFHVSGRTDGIQRTILHSGTLTQRQTSHFHGSCFILLQMY